ncbi:MAG: calcium-binding protein [Bythopirellula sp.]
MSHHNGKAENTIMPLRFINQRTAGITIDHCAENEPVPPPETPSSSTESFRRGLIRRAGINSTRNGVQLGIERLEQRNLLAVTASFSAAGGLLQVTGDNFDNIIEISRAANGNILVNDGQVAIVGGIPTVNNTTVILASGLDGNDSILLNEFNGALPQATLLGGDDNDTLIGGAGEDTILGGAGNDLLRGGDNVDRMFGGSGNDTLLGDRGNDNVQGQSGFDLLIWNNGDGSDTIEGGTDNDVVQVNGANGAGDDFSIDPNGSRVRFQRNNLGLFALDIGGVEDLDVNGQGGGDIIAGSVGLVGLIELDLDGGEGNDLLIGGDGIDTLRGGAGNDTLIGGKGNDVKLGEQGDDLFVWNNGDGSDFIEGGDDQDTVQVNGANGAGDDFSIDPNGARVRFQRNNLGLFQLDIGTTEDLDVNGQGGNDTIAGGVGLLGLIELDLDGGEGNDLIIGGDGGDTLRGGAGDDTLIGGKGNDVKLGETGDDLLVWNNGDGSDFLEGGDDRDTVQVDGTDAAGDDLSITPNGSRVRLQRNNLALFQLDIGTTEILDVNGQGGNDDIAASLGLAGLIEIEFSGGLDDDALTGSDANDTFFYAGDTGDDSILNFTAGPGVGDVIVLSGYGATLDSFADVMAAAVTVGFNTEIALPTGDSITLVFVAKANLVADDFRFDSADFDGDNDTDGHDFLAWQRGFGITAPNATGADGDADGDQDVDGDDLTLWSAQYGPATPLAAALSPTASRAIAGPTVSTHSPAQRNTEELTRTTALDAALAEPLSISVHNRRSSQARVPSLRRNESADNAPERDLLFDALGQARVVTRIGGIHDGLIG